MGVSGVQEEEEEEASPFDLDCFKELSATICHEKQNELFCKSS